jgi:hypothetical protein
MPTTVNDGTLSAGDISFYLSKQAVKGAINTSPVFTPVLRTSGRFKKTINYSQSSVVSLDFNGVKQLQDESDLAAEIETEFTEATVDNLVSGMHAEFTTVTVTGANIAFTATGITSASDAFTGFDELDFVFISGATNAALNIAYQVEAKVDNGELTLYPAPAATELAGATITVMTSKAYNANLPTYYVGQNRMLDLSKAGNIDFETPFDGIINQVVAAMPETGSFTSTASMLFERESAGTAAIAGQTDAATPTDDPLTAVQGISRWLFAGETSTCKTKSLTVTINNNYQADSAAGCVKRYSRGQPEFTIEGAARSDRTMSTYYRDLYYAGTRVSHAVILKHPGNKFTVISIPQMVLTAWDTPDGQGAVVTNEYSAQAERSDVTGYTIAVFKNW